MARTLSEISKERDKIQNELTKVLRNTRKDLPTTRRDVREKIICGEEIPTIEGAVSLESLLKTEYELERENARIFLIAEMIAAGKDPRTPQFDHELNLGLTRRDMELFNKDQIDNYRQNVQERVIFGQTILAKDAAGQLLLREFQNERALKRFSLEEDLISRGYEKDSELLKKEVNLKMIQSEKQLLNAELLSRYEKEFREKKGRGEQIDNSNSYFVLLEEERQLEEEVAALNKKNEEKKLQQQMQEQTQQKAQNNQKEEQEHKYAVEFAGRELKPEIKNCGDPKILAQYLKDATHLSKDAREHLEARVAANAKIESYEKNRAIKQKNRPPAVKYKDGTILLKNKKKDVPKQTTMNGCWSAVLSDMLGHFGVDLSQEEIRAYRPELANDLTQKDNGLKLMNRLNRDCVNEISDLADLIQRTVPNVAHHHMSFGVGREENKEMLKKTVTDALLNKNSPVAVRYKNHYLSIVGIKDNTLIVQNSNPKYNSKYQKLSINDLFEGCKEKSGEGQVTIDWLEDLKFEKNGTCQNISKKWRNMGISCKKREFAKGMQSNYVSHVRGNEYHDISRLEKGIEETIYLPKMSFGREKDLEKHDKEIIKEDKTLVNKETEIQELTLNEMQ